MTNQLITIIIPVYNSETTLNELFDSLEAQEDKELVREILLINDNSTDNSQKIIDEYVSKSSFQVQSILRTKNVGTGNNNNKGIDICQTEYFILMNDDIIVQDAKSFSKMLQPFADPKVICSYSTPIYPYTVWKSYNFWQKCLFSRQVGSEIPGMSNKFDCFKKTPLLENVGLFDGKTYKNAGENGDLSERIKESGYKAVPSHVKVIHLHNKDENFNLTQIIQKEAQMAEAQGTLLRHYPLSKIKDIREFALTYFRPLLLLSLGVPYLQIVSFLLILVYSFLYTKLVYLEEFRNWRIIFLPFINISLLFVALFYTAKGFVYGKQQI